MTGRCDATSSHIAADLIQCDTTEMKLLLILAVFVLASCAEVRKGPPCTVTGRPIVTQVSDLPLGVLKNLPDKMASADEAFNSTDYASYWERNLPFMRLVCGYAIDGRYIVEEEHGTIAAGVGKIVFQKTPSGYSFVSHKQGFKLKDIPIR